MKKKEFVVDKLCRQVRNAFDAKKPLIMIDTNEIELVKRVVGCCGVVDLKLKSESRNLRSNFYYNQYIKADENELVFCENFSSYFKDLKELISSGLSVNFGHDTPNKTQAKLLMLPLVSLSGKQTANPNVIELLREYVRSYIGFDDYSPIRSSCVILYGDSSLITDDLSAYTEIIEPDYPSTEEIRQTISSLINKYGDKKYTYHTEDMNELAYNMRGFTLIQTEFFIKKMLRLKQENDAPLLCSKKECKKQILEAKIQNLMRFGSLLTLYIDKNDENNGADKIGGMKTFNEKAEEIQKSLTEDFCMKRGNLPYKGALLVGVPGCGKSEASKLLHRKLNIPMLKLDMGSLMGGVVGLSEKNLREALRQADAMSPCILFIDEIEKGLSGAGSGENDGGTSKRMFGYLLSWLSDKTSPCFVCATANDISNLPKEFYRNQRFDIRYGVFMPTQNELKSIIAEQMNRRERERKKQAEVKGIEFSHDLFDNDCFEENSNRSTVPDNVIDLFTHKNGTQRNENEIKFVTGADIAQIVTEALNNHTDEELEEPLKLNKWKEALGKVIDDDTMQTQGSSSSNLDAIAACYIRLLRKELVPVNDEVLFTKKDYNEGFKINRNNNFKGKTYDQMLYSVIRERSEKLFEEVDKIEQRKDCGF